ncbi:MAG: hypothetical protein ACOC6N_00655 [archaeon]
MEQQLHGINDHMDGMGKHLPSPQRTTPSTTCTNNRARIDTHSQGY